MIRTRSVYTMLVMASIMAVGAFSSYSVPQQHRRQHLPRGGGSTKVLKQKPSTLNSLWSSITSDQDVSKPKDVVVTPPETEASVAPAKKNEPESPKHLDLYLMASYMCNTFVLAIPIVVMPLIAAEHAAGAGAGFAAAAFLATVASISMLGGGMGKVINGFVCKWLGGLNSASLYLTTMGVFSFLLSVNRSGPMLGLILGAIEFCASIQWIAHSMLLANHYKGDPKGLSTGIATLSVGSTAGILAAKVGGTALLQVASWRTLAQVGAAVAWGGALLVRSLVPEHPKSTRDLMARQATIAAKSPSPAKKEKGGGVGDLVTTLKHVVGGRLFWQAGMAHAVTYLARSSDKVLGRFFEDVTMLPKSVCGGLTVCVTFGFLHGLSKVRQFHALPDREAKSNMLRKGYATAVVSTIGLALCANKWLTNLVIPSQYALAGLVSALAGLMASSLSFQFYQLPNMVAGGYGENRSVCLSFLDGLGFFLSAPVWAATGQIVSRLGDHGWSVALALLAALYGMGGLGMLDVFPTVMDRHEGKKAATA